MSSNDLLIINKLIEKKKNNEIQFSLSLEASNLHAIQPITQFEKLSYLSLANNKINDLKPLANLKELWELNISNNYIKDLSPLKTFAVLGSLTISSYMHQYLNDINALFCIELKITGFFKESIIKVLNLIPRIWIINDNYIDYKSRPNYSTFSKITGKFNKNAIVNERAHQFIELFSNDDYYVSSGKITLNEETNKILYMLEDFCFRTNLKLNDSTKNIPYFAINVQNWGYKKSSYLFIILILIYLFISRLISRFALKVLLNSYSEQFKNNFKNIVKFVSTLQINHMIGFFVKFHKNVLLIFKRKAKNLSKEITKNLPIINLYSEKVVLELPYLSQFFLKEPNFVGISPLIQSSRREDLKNLCNIIYISSLNEIKQNFLPKNQHSHILGLLLLLGIDIGKKKLDKNIDTEATKLLYNTNRDSNLFHSLESVKDQPNKSISKSKNIIPLSNTISKFQLSQEESIVQSFSLIPRLKLKQISKISKKPFLHSSYESRNNEDFKALNHLRISNTLKSVSSKVSEAVWKNDSKNLGVVNRLRTIRRQSLKRRNKDTNYVQIETFRKLFSSENINSSLDRDTIEKPIESQLYPFLYQADTSNIFNFSFTLINDSKTKKSNNNSKPIIDLNELSSDIVDCKSILLKRKKSNKNSLIKEINQQPNLKNEQQQSNFYNDSIKKPYNSFNRINSDKLVQSLKMKRFNTNDEGQIDTVIVPVYKNLINSSEKKADKILDILNRKHSPWVSYQLIPHISIKKNWKKMYEG